MELFHKRVIITRPREQASGFASRLKDLGAIPICFPVIQIAPEPETSTLDQALRTLNRYHWLVLTSVNGVQVTWERLARLNIQSLPDGLKIAAIGPKTAAALQAVGIQPDFIPDEYVAEAILPGLGNLKGLWVLLLRADIARTSLPEAIQRAGGVAHEIAVYKTLPAEPEPAALEALRSGVDVVTFTSSSTVRNFVRLVMQAGLDPIVLPGSPLYACIGPVTAQTAREHGLPVGLVATQYTSDGLVQALLDH